jgi:chromosome partitioning protein
MRRIALINQKGGVGKTTVTANLGAALARAGKRVVVVDLDPQANLTLYLGIELAGGEPSTYRVLTGEVPFGDALRPTTTPNLRILPTDIHLSGAELEISGTKGREGLLRGALEAWRKEHAGRRGGEEPADYVLYDCPPSLGLLSLNALSASDEVFLVVQTQFLALQGMSKLVEVIELVKQELHPGLKLTGIVSCLYDSRMRLAREVLSELRHYFPAQVFRTPISTNVKLAESPSFAKTIFEYAPESIGARDFASLAHEVLTQEALVSAAAAEPVSKGKKRGALESFARSPVAASAAPAVERPPGAPPPVPPHPKRVPRKRSEEEAPASVAPRPAKVIPPAPRPLELERPVPAPRPPATPAPEPIAAVPPRRVRPKATGSH